MIIEQNLIKLACQRASLNSRAIEGLLGEQRVRYNIPDNYKENATTGAWLISNYLGENTHHALMIPHAHDTSEPIENLDNLSEVPLDIATIGALRYSLGVDVFYCVPFLRANIQAFSNNNTNAEIKRYLKNNALPITGNKSELLERVSSPFYKIDYMCYDLGNISHQPLPLKQILRTNGFTIKNGHVRQFANANEQSIEGLTESTINEYFWKQHLWWRLKSFTPSPAADLDALFTGSKGVYVIEIKTKSIAPSSSNFPEYFGIDIGTITKMLMFEGRGDQRSKGIFIVEERDESGTPLRYHATTMRNLYSNMNLVSGQGGASGFGGGGTSVIKVPIHAFTAMDNNFFEHL